MLKIIIITFHNWKQRGRDRVEETDEKRQRGRDRGEKRQRERDRGEGGET
jgi:hypothetical protein